MSPKAKKIKTDHVESTETIKVEEKEPEWYLLEDLEAEDIDDEYGDMVIEQRLLVNNVVIQLIHLLYTFQYSNIFFKIGRYRTYYRRYQVKRYAFH